MELIREICDRDIGLPGSEVKTYRLRKAARSLVFNEDGKIALLYVSENNYHKLPGGGVEKGEDIQITLSREVKEEVGANVQVLGEIGIIIEYREEQELLHISYCHYSKIEGELGKTSFTEDEINDGFVLKWVEFKKAIEILENDKPNNYTGKFIHERDLTFLKRAKEVINFNSL